jgi:protein-tyrosine phosphatase
MTYAVAFAVLAVFLGAEAVIVGGWLGGFVLWPAVSFAALALAYAGLGPGVFGKRADGTLAAWSVSLLLPYLLLVWAVWHAWRLFSREPVASEVAPGLWIGRRPLPDEVPPGVLVVVDLTTEFPELRGVCRGRDYLHLPMLDAAAGGDEAEFRELVAAVAHCKKPVLIHCALGHGRSALTAAAVLLERGLAKDAADAEAKVRAARPGVELKPSQRRLLEDFARQGHRASGGA